MSCGDGVGFSLGADVGADGLDAGGLGDGGGAAFVVAGEEDSGEAHGVQGRDGGGGVGFDGVGEGDGAKEMGCIIVHVKDGDGGFGGGGFGAADEIGLAGKGGGDAVARLVVESGRGLQLEVLRAGAVDDGFAEGMLAELFGGWRRW